MSMLYGPAKPSVGEKNGNRPSVGRRKGKLYQRYTGFTYTHTHIHTHTLTSFSISQARGRSRASTLLSKSSPSLRCALSHFLLLLSSSLSQIEAVLPFHPIFFQLPCCYSFNSPLSLPLPLLLSLSFSFSLYFSLSLPFAVISQLPCSLSIPISPVQYSDV